MYIFKTLSLCYLTETDSGMYNLIQKFSARLLSPMLQNFLKMFLSLRAYSPTVEMFQQVGVSFIALTVESVCTSKVK